MKKTIGILGGMGPEATADIFLKIIKNTPASKDQEHLRVVIDSNPEIPDRTAYILGNGPDPRPLLLATARNVEKMGAELIAIPCNTAHFFHEEIQAAVSVPVLHMMNEVAAHLRGKVRKVGLLASSGTVQARLYDKALEKAGIVTLVPEEEDQKLVMESIYSVKAGKLSPARDIAIRQGHLLASRGAEVVIAGCTEIPLVLHDGDLNVPVVDATEILAKKCVSMALGG